LDSSYFDGNCAGLDINFGSGLDLFMLCNSYRSIFHISRFCENGKIQMLLLSYSFKQLIQDIVDHHVKDHKAFTLKGKEKNLEEKSGKLGFQTKDFDFIAGNVLSDSIF
jgi:hypothetical protein